MKDELASLRREVSRQRAWIEELASALHTHARTDLAPDTALPALRELVRKIARAPR